MSTPGILRSRKMQKIGLGLVLFVVVIMPHFFLPVVGVEVESAKLLLLSVATMVLLLMGLFFEVKTPRQKSGNFDWMTGLFATLLVVTAIAVGFSLQPRESLIGLGFQLATWSGILNIVVFSFLASRYIKNVTHQAWLYISLLLTLTVSFVLQLVKFVVPAWQGIAGLGGVEQTLVGHVSDLAWWAGFLVLLALVTLQFLQLKQVIRVVVGAVGVLASVFVLLLGSVALKTILALGIFLLLLYHISSTHAVDRKRKGYRLVLAIHAVIFLILTIPMFANVARQISPVSEISTMSFGQTILSPQFIGAGWSHNQLFGAGPNMIERLVDSTYFPAGNALVARPAFLHGQIIGGGPLVGLIWAAFLALLIYFGVLVFRHTYRHQIEHYFTISLWVSTAFFWLGLVVFPAHTYFVLIAILFFVLLGRKIDELGLARAVLSRMLFWRRPNKLILYSALGLLLVVLLIGNIMSLSARSQVIRMQLGGSIDNVLSVARQNHSDAWWRLGYQEASGRLQASVASALDAGEPVAQSEAAMQALDDALEAAQSAYQYDPSHVANIAVLVGAYRNAAALGSGEAQTKAGELIERALRQRPDVRDFHLERLLLLQLEPADLEETTAAINEALALFPTDMDLAVVSYRYVLSQGMNPVDARRVLLGTINHNTNNPEALVQLAELAYASGDAQLADQLYGTIIARYSVSAAVADRAETIKQSLVNTSG